MSCKVESDQHAKKRLRAHQGHISGGVRTTRRWVTRHGPQAITMYLLVGPLTKQSAQSLERHWKNKRGRGPAGIQGRVTALIAMLEDASLCEGFLSEKCYIGPRVKVRTPCSQSLFMSMVGDKVHHLPALVQWRFQCDVPDCL